MPTGAASRQHTEWLNLVEVAGPFLSVPVLLEALPQGLEDVDPALRARVRLAWAEWQADPELLHRWVAFVLAEVLDTPAEVLREGPSVPPTLEVTVAEHDEVLRPDAAVLDPNSGKPRLLIRVWPSQQALDGRIRGSRWAAS